MTDKAGEMRDALGFYAIALANKKSATDLAISAQTLLDAARKAEAEASAELMAAHAKLDGCVLAVGDA